MVSAGPVGDGAGSGTSAPAWSRTVQLNGPAQAGDVGVVVAVKVTCPVVPFASTQRVGRLDVTCRSWQTGSPPQTGTTTPGFVPVEKVTGVVVVGPPGGVRTTNADGCTVPGR